MNSVIFFKKYREIEWVNNIKLTWILFHNLHFPQKISKIHAFEH